MNLPGGRSANALAAHMAWRKSGTVPGLSAAGRKVLGRGFGRDVRCRILLIYQDHPLAYMQFYPFLHYTSRFARLGIQFRAMPYAALNPDILPPGLDAIFLQSSYTPASGELEGMLRRLKANRPNLRISYFDWFAPTDVRMAERVEPWVEAYVKKSLLRDRDAYRIPTLGHTNLTDHYGPRFGVENPPRTWNVPPEIVDRLIAGPAFSTASVLIRQFESDRLIPDGPRPIDLHARIATKGTPWYTAMRTETQDALAAFPDLKVISSGRVSLKAFNQELAQSKLCFSPFGYGEICWRDFEAIAAGSVLVKPDMSHIDADPDIYQPFETYIPVRWDLTDLDEKVRAALADPAGMRRIAERAYAVVHDHLKGPTLENLVKHLAGFG